MYSVASTSVNSYLSEMIIFEREVIVLCVAIQKLGWSYHFPFIFRILH